jgi:type III pantothenate kinase
MADRRIVSVKTFVLSVGNTSFFAGVFASEKLVTSFRVPRREAATRDGFARLVAARVRGTVDRAAFCSVVPALTKKVAAEIRRHWAVAPRVLTTATPHGLKIGYHRPRELGTDRLAAALGACARFPRRHVIVVDCGTATTVTALHRDGTLLGGAIFPGLSLWPQMLASRTAQLPEAEIVAPRAALGRSTAAALQSGMFHGHAGAIRETVRRIRAEAFGRADVVVVGTGGHAERFAEIFDAIEPDLVLRGLRRIA